MEDSTDSDTVITPIHREALDLMQGIKKGLANNPAYILNYFVNQVINDAEPDGIVDDSTNNYHNTTYKGRRVGDDKRVIKWCIKHLPELKDKVEQEFGRNYYWGILGIIILNKHLYTPKEKDVVYFIRNLNGLVKIGFTSNLPERLKALISHSGNELEVLCTFTPANTDIAYIESRLHGRYGGSRKMGEWFEIEPNLKEWKAFCEDFDNGE